jgi:mRNA interferase RelE/StbE
VTHRIQWEPEAIDRLAALTQDYPEAPRIVVAAVYELADNPRPSNSTRLGTSPFRRLLLGHWRITYEVHDADQLVRIILIGRSPQPR